MSTPKKTDTELEDEMDEKITSIIQQVTLEHPAIGKYTLWDISPTESQDEWGYILFKDLKTLIADHQTKLLQSLLEKMPEQDEHSHITRNYCLDCAKRDGHNAALTKVTAVIEDALKGASNAKQ